MRRLRPFVVLIALCGASGCNDDGSITVRSLTFIGVKAIAVSRLPAVLATRENTRVPLVGWQLPWSRKQHFDRSRFDADLKRIEAFYADRGFPDARVTAFDVKLNDKQDAVDITLTINEGEPVLVAAIELREFDVIPPGHLETLRNQLPLKVGEPRDRQKVVASHEMAVNELRDHGYPYAKAATSADDGAGGKQARIVFTAAPSTLAHFGPVEITGNRTVSEGIIRRQLTFKPGELYRRSVVQDSQRRLYVLELFQFVNVEALNPEREEPEVRMRVTVVEGKHQRVNFGVGYGTEEKARADAEYHHVNFFGGARTAGAHGRYSSLDRGIRFDFVQPYLFTPHFAGGADGQQWYTYTPAYRSVVTGGKLTLTHRTSQRSSWAISTSSERTNSTIEDVALNDPELYIQLIALGLDPRTGSQSGTLSTVGFDFQHSTGDNILNARRGYQIAFHGEVAGRWLPGTFDYRALTADARHYLPVSNRLVWANRVQVGSIAPANDDPTQVPFSKKYFLGGAGSIRGWGRYEISPLAGGYPVGGNSLFAFTSEARATLRGNLGGVLFLDSGNVWEHAWTAKLNDLRYAVGTGLRYQTPVGPIRFDVGYQLNPEPDLLMNGAPETRHWRLHFSIGQAF